MDAARGSAHGHGPLSARNRALARAQRRNNIRLRLRDMDEAYTKASPITKQLRQLILVATYVLTWSDIWFSLTILVSAVSHSDWLGLNVCLCSYRCGGAWHTEYTKTPHWNVTFVPDSCPDEVWTCQVQQEWDECVCNERGTEATSATLLLNTGGCDFYEITHDFLLLDAVVVALGLVMTTAMFKLAQYAPSADPVNLTRVVFFWLPTSLQAACHAQPFESKALFLMSYALFFVAWLVSVVLAIWFQIGRLGFSGDNNLEKLPLSSSEYELPSHFQRVQTWASILHAVTLVAQTLGLYGWRLGAEAQFRVTPRLKQLFLRQPGNTGKPRVLYSVDSNGSVSRAGRSGGGGARSRNNNNTRSQSVVNARARRERERSVHLHRPGQMGLGAALQGGIQGGFNGLSALGHGVLGGIQSGYEHGALGFPRHSGQPAGREEDGPPERGGVLFDGGVGNGRVLGGVVGGVVGGLGGLATGVVGGGLNAMFGNGYGELDDEDDEDEDGAEVVDGEPLFFNVITGIKPTSAIGGEDEKAAEEEDFVLHFKVDFVDATGRPVSPAPGLPLPLLSLAVLPGEPSHSFELSCTTTSEHSNAATTASWMKRVCLQYFGTDKSSSSYGSSASSSSGTTVHVFECAVPASHFLGRHRLELWQPLASQKDIARAEMQAKSVARRESGLWNFENRMKRGKNMSGDGDFIAGASNGGVKGASGGHNNNALGVGSGRIPSEDDDNNRPLPLPLSYDNSLGSVESTEEQDTLLAACSYHEVTDLTFIDSEYEKRKFLALEERVDDVRAKVDELSPQVEAVFARHKAEVAHEGEVATIHQDPALHDYYVLFQMRVVGVAVSCAAIASGMVENQAGPGGRTSSMLKGVAAIQFLGDNCNLPFAGLATALIGGAAVAYAEHEKKVRVKRINDVFYTPAQADKIAEAVARAVCLNARFIQNVRALDATDELDAKQRSLPGKPGVVRRLGEVLKECSDMASMADLAYADTQVKQRAEIDAQLIVDCIMSGHLEAALTARANARAAQEKEEEEEEAEKQKAQSQSAGQSEGKKEDNNTDAEPEQASSEVKASDQSLAHAQQPPSLPSSSSSSSSPSTYNYSNPDDELVEILASFLAPPSLPSPSESLERSESASRASKTSLDRNSTPAAVEPAVAPEASATASNATPSRNSEAANPSESAPSTHSSLLPPRPSFSSSSVVSSSSDADRNSRSTLRRQGSDLRGGNTTINSYKTAVRYLREGLEFTKTTHGIFTYRYKLVLADSSRSPAAAMPNGGSLSHHQGPRLEWCRLDKDPTKEDNVHIMPLDATLTATSPAPPSQAPLSPASKATSAAAATTTAASKKRDMAVSKAQHKAQRTVVVTGMSGSSTFVFAHASQAEQFRACLALVIAEVFGNGASSSNGGNSGHLQSGSSGGSGAVTKWEKSPVVVAETDL